MSNDRPRPVLATDEGGGHEPPDLPVRNVPPPSEEPLPEEDPNVVVGAPICVFCDKAIPHSPVVVEMGRSSAKWAHASCRDHQEMNEAAAREAWQQPKPLITIDIRSVKSYRRRLAIALAWIRIPFDIVVRGRAVIPDR